MSITKVTDGDSPLGESLCRDPTPPPPTNHPDEATNSRPTPCSCDVTR